MTYYNFIIIEIFCQFLKWSLGIIEVNCKKNNYSPVLKRDKKGGAKKWTKKNPSEKLRRILWLMFWLITASERSLPGGLLRLQLCQR